MTRARRSTMLCRFNMRYSGLAGAKGFYEAANTAFPDFSIGCVGEYDGPGSSIRELTISGTHTGDWYGVAGISRHIRFQLAGFFVFGTGNRRAN
jgi:hypothetical protein